MAGASRPRRTPRRGFSADRESTRKAPAFVVAGANIRQIGVEVEVQCRSLEAPLELVFKPAADRDRRQPQSAGLLGQQKAVADLGGLGLVPYLLILNEVELATVKRHCASDRRRISDPGNDDIHRWNVAPPETRLAECLAKVVTDRAIRDSSASHTLNAEEARTP
jgi:hypothetical protein